MLRVEHVGPREMRVRSEKPLFSLSENVFETVVIATRPPKSAQVSYKSLPDGFGDRAYRCPECKGRTRYQRAGPRDGLWVPMHLRTCSKAYSTRCETCRGKGVVTLPKVTVFPARGKAYGLEPPGSRKAPCRRCRGKGAITPAQWRRLVARGEKLDGSLVPAAL